MCTRACACVGLCVCVHACTYIMCVLRSVVRHMCVGVTVEGQTT